LNFAEPQRLMKQLSQLADGLRGHRIRRRTEDACSWDWTKHSWLRRALAIKTAVGEQPTYHRLDKFGRRRRTPDFSVIPTCSRTGLSTLAGVGPVDVKPFIWGTPIGVLSERGVYQSQHSVEHRGKFKGEVTL